MASPTSAHQNSPSVPPPVNRAIPTGPCPGATVMQHHVPAYEVKDHVSPLYGIDVHLSHPYHLEWKSGSKYKRTWMVPGAICISPASEAISMRWRENIDILSIGLEPSILLRAAEDMKLHGPIEIPERHGDCDPLIAHISQALWAEAQLGYPTGRVFGESMIVALSSRVLQTYSVQRLVAPLENRLSPRCWNRVRDFIEENLESNLSLSDMAEIARLSPCYFARCFKVTTGLSPHQYVIERRVERARQLLSNPQLSLAQIAAQCGFSDQSHFSRQFKWALGVTPASLQARPQTRRKNIQ